MVDVVIVVNFDIVVVTAACGMLCVFVHGRCLRSKVDKEGRLVDPETRETQQQLVIIEVMAMLHTLRVSDHTFPLVEHNSFVAPFKSCSCRCFIMVAMVKSQAHSYLFFK